MSEVLIVKKNILFHRNLLLFILLFSIHESITGVCYLSGNPGTDPVGLMNQTSAFSEKTVSGQNYEGFSGLNGSAIGSEETFRKYPYLIYPGRNDLMTLLWQTFDSLSCIVEWGLTPSSLLGDTISIEYGDDHQHRMDFDNLIPETRYYYRVIADGDTANGNFFTGKYDSDEKIIFYAYGDTRTYPADHDSVAGQILRNIASSDSNQTFIISNGDLVGRSPDETSDWTPSEEKWDVQFFDPQYHNIQKLLRTMPYMASVGNYEVAAEGVFFRKYFPYNMFGQNRFYYSFDNGPVHFTIIDQYSDYSIGSDQYNWIKNDLETTAKKWKIILLHEPGWSAGSHGNNTDVQNILQPLAVENGVQFFFAGHNHYYSRAVVDGIVHITTGGGGAPLYNPVQTYPKIVKVDKSYHFCKIEIDGDSLLFTAIRADGSIIESFYYNDIEIEPKYNLSISKLGSGKVVVTPLKEEYEKNEMVILQALPDSGYTFSGWSGDASGTELYYYLFMDKDKNVTATFNEITTGITNSGSLLSDLTVFPNPPTDIVKISYRLKSSADVQLAIYNLLGKMIVSLVNRKQAAGYYSFDWQINVGSDIFLEKGVYIIRLKTGTEVAVKKIILSL